MTVLDLVAMGAWRRVGAWRHRGEELDGCMQALETVGLAAEAGRGLDALSGGQMQRALFARMLVQDASVLLLDEPFAAVDSHTADQLMALLCGLHQQGRTVIAVLHDLDVVRAFSAACSRVRRSAHGLAATRAAREVLHDGVARSFSALLRIRAAREAHLRRSREPGMTLAGWIVSPFLDYGFMRRALAGACALSLGAAPLGVFLVLRRMSLMGDAMSHAILPGVAAGFLLSGLSLWAMMLGGILTGLAVALLSGLVARLTPLREDASFAAFYLISLGLGVLLVLRGSTWTSCTCCSAPCWGWMTMPCCWSRARPASRCWRWPPPTACWWLNAWTRDSCASGGAGGWVHMGFLVLVVVNLVAGFQVLGTLMVVGMMMLPAASARFWALSAARQIPLAAGLGCSRPWPACWFPITSMCPPRPPSSWSRAAVTSFPSSAAREALRRRLAGRA